MYTVTTNKKKSSCYTINKNSKITHTHTSMIYLMYIHTHTHTACGGVEQQYFNPKCVKKFFFLFIVCLRCILHTLYRALMYGKWVDILSIYVWWWRVVRWYCRWLFCIFCRQCMYTQYNVMVFIHTFMETMLYLGLVIQNPHSTK